MKRVDEIGLPELEEMAENMYGELVKAVVDVEKRTDESTRALIIEIVGEIVHG